MGFNLSLNYESNPQSKGWTHQQGWPVTIKVNYSYDNQINDLVFFDLDNDNNLDVVVTYSISEEESYIDAYCLNGSQKIDAGFPILLPGKILGEVSIGDLDNDGYIEIVASISIFSDEFHTNIFVFEYDSKKFVETWNFIESKIGGEIIYSPSLGDIDGDGDLEIILGNQRYTTQWKNVVYALHNDGTMVTGWPVTNKFYLGSYYATPALGDIDNDGFLEVVVGSYFKYLYAWNDDGNPVSGNWPVFLNDDVRSHSPQLGDIDGDGEIEIVQIGARYGNISILNGQGDIIRILYPDIADYCCNPALGDIDNDGDLEIFTNIGDYIYGWHHNGDKVADYWPVFIGNITYTARSSIIIGDINSDNLSDIIFIRDSSIEGIDIFSYNSNGSLINGWPYTFEKASSVRSSPSLVDIDKDGDIEIGFTYLYQEAYPNLTSNLTIDILDISETYNSSSIQWPMFQNNPQHTGLYKKPGNTPPEKPNINGPFNGKIGTEYSYTAISNDPDGENISYLFDWGDGTNSGWTDLVLTGTEVNRSHTWFWKGTYKVMVKVKDINSAQSDWAILEVTIPRDKTLVGSLLFQLLERLPILNKLRFFFMNILIKFII